MVGGFTTRKAVKMNCDCGHAEDEHGQDPNYPGWSACKIEWCECICFEWDGDEEQDE